MLAALALGAEAVQIGSRFVASTESSAHLNFKNAVVEANDGGTQLSLKKLTPVRLIKNKFWEDITAAEASGASAAVLEKMLGRARAKKGMFEGDLEEGELEIGQISGYINQIKPAAKIVEEIVDEFNQESEKLANVRL
jgi:enoyl-[acyl-carrier protein] reductase II